MSNLFENAVNAVKLAFHGESELKAKLAEVQALAEETASAITVACNESFAWFMSVGRKHGAKAQLAEAAGVSQKTIGRYIAGGYVAMVTDGKVEAGVACNAINNYDMKLSEVESVKSVSEWNKLLKAYKAVNKNGAGNNGNGKGKTESESTETPEEEVTGEYWEQLAQALAEEIASGAVSLEVVAEYITAIVADSMATV
jgi:hypothetical protein